MSKDEGSVPPSLESVYRRLDALKRTRKETPSSIAPSGDAARGAIDFASASAVGTVLGYALDQWLDSGPWGLVGGLVLGCAAGVKMMLDAEKRSSRNGKKADESTANETNAQE